MKTAPTNKKVRELINLVKEEKLIPRPEFQRRLVWAQKDKDHFLDSVLKGYPFPEIYIADGDVDLDSAEGTQLLVDGLQRVSTLIEYFDGSTNLRLTQTPDYDQLNEDEKRFFLQYDISVRDLGAVTREELVEVFRRINATKYSLLDIEVNNAIYAGALKRCAEDVAANQFLTENGVFNARDYKRMGDLRYALTLIITLLEGYFNRDDEFGDLLERFNDEFPHEENVKERLQDCFDLIEESGFKKNSRIWKKADLLSVVVELDLMRQEGFEFPQPSDLVETLERFYSDINNASLEDNDLAGVYYKAAMQATNDKINRVRRGYIIGGIIRGKSRDEIDDELMQAGLKR